ncbi:DNA gyrase subunit A [uncultured Eubacterium sp.]|uniref:DNA gyrase subunit A n=1 Tax=uncultured Eubacterium sp. TaxID=165185 RepID=UPI002673E608|nr:DNA gyrase subunit A [uncultured Eubacterium sp.]
MDDKIFDRIHEVDLKETMETSYIDYAMSVIAARALPDVRDGLKPVQRRVLYSMVELNNGPDKPHRKCARIVGDTMGKYHPHGDSSIYGALVNMAQEWSTRYPLVDGHGNFGSEDGDGAAAMRYTEARLSKISMEMVADINKDTVDFVPNFDETEKEPTVLPSRYPNLLVNGTSGIAVGMATNIPPHNLKETINAIIKIIDNKVDENRDTEIEEVMEIIKGPDFPTGATILGRRDIEEAYRTGRGKIKTRAVSEIETMENGKSRIVVTELPYMVNKAKLVEKIASLVKEKKIDGITDLRDESDQEGTRVVIEVRRDANANVILNQLYKHTQLQDSFGVIMLALVNGEPKVLNLLQMLDEYLKHQKDVVTRRTKFELNKAEERAHIIKGLLIALDNIDEVIKIIRGSRTTADAKNSLCERFGLSDAQAQAIVDMRLRQLTGLAREDLEAEYNELMAKIEYLKSILADENKLLTVIKEEITVIRDKFGDERRTKIGLNIGDLSDEDLIPEEDTVVAMTNLGYIKRMTVDNFKSQNRGGKGIKGMQTIDNDFMKDMFMLSTHDYILFLTNTGRIYKLKCYEIPEAGRTARGMAIVNLLQLQPGEKISAMVQMREFEDDKYLIMATKNGVIKKTPVNAYTNIRKSGIQAITLRENDELIDVMISDNTDNIMLITKKGHGIKFRETDVRETGRSAMGVRGIELNSGDEVISMQLESQGECILIVSANGMGKRTPFSEFKLQNRGGKGVKCYKIADKTGDVVGAKAVNDGNEIMMITNEGIIIRMFVDDISVLGRVTLGVKLMNTGNDSDIVVASITKVKESVTEADAEEAKLIESEDDIDINKTENSSETE